MRWNESYGLPLLAKELIEQSARKRTYLVRSVYAMMFFGFTLMLFWGEFYNDATNPLELLGKGREMFNVLIGIQIFGVALFTPALTCGTITSEKERNTIGLLFLTKLGPLSILFEKYLGRLFVMGSFLLISLPLLGFCYTLGGIEQRQVWFGFYGLILTVCQLAALGLFCSAYFRTTVSAFIASYLIGITMFFGPMFLYEMGLREGGLNLAAPIWSAVQGVLYSLGSMGQMGLIGTGQLLGLDLASLLKWEPFWESIGYADQPLSHFLFFAPPLIMDAMEGFPRVVPTWQLFALGMPTMGITLFYLMLARLCLVYRAFASPKRYLLRLFQLLDRTFHRANNNRFTRGIVLIREQSSLPKYDPIAWRETTKTTLGSFRYLIRIFLVIEFPVFTLCLLAVSLSSQGYYQSNRSEATVAINFICWIIAILLTVVRSATLVAGERSHETLDVLLTTPISSRNFLLQKIKGVNRLIIVVSIPLLTGILMQAWYCSINNGWFSKDFVQRPDRSPLCYLLTMIPCLIVYLQLFSWLSLLLGMLMKTSTRAIFASLACIVGWMILPFVFLLVLFALLDRGNDNLLSLLLISSPATIPFLSEIGELNDLYDDGVIWVAICTNIMVYTSLLVALRYFCLGRAAKLLGRSEDQWR